MKTYLAPDPILHEGLVTEIVVPMEPQPVDGQWCFVCRVKKENP